MTKRTTDHESISHIYHRIADLEIKASHLIYTLMKRDS